MRILIRQIGTQIFEYLFVFRGRLYGNHFVFNDLQKKKLEKKQSGGIAFLVANTAEAHVDKMRRLKLLHTRIWYIIKSKFIVQNNNA